MDLHRRTKREMLGYGRGPGKVAGIRPLVLGDICIGVPEVEVSGVAVYQSLPWLRKGWIMRRVARAAGRRWRSGGHGGGKY